MSRNQVQIQFSTNVSKDMLKEQRRIFKVTEAHDTNSPPLNLCVLEQVCKVLMKHNGAFLMTGVHRASLGLLNLYQSTV